MSFDEHRDRDADKIFREVREAFIRRADDSFDFDTGLADVFARAGLDRRTAAAAAPVPPTWWPVPDTVAAVCEQADRLASVLSLLAPGDPPLASDHLQRARELVFEFRSIMSTADRPHPERLAALLTRVTGHLDSADRLVRARGSSSLADALRAALGDLGPLPVDPFRELQTLRSLTSAAFDDSPHRPGHSSHRPTARRDRAAGERHDD